MPPPLALLLCLCPTAWLFWRYPERKAGVSCALWIPLAWLFIVSSRPITVWMGGRASEDFSEGSPLDSLIFLALIIVICGTRFAAIRKKLGVYGVGLGVLLAFLQVAVNLPEFLAQ